MDEDRIATTKVRETSIGDFCEHCGQYLKERSISCPACGCLIVINEKEMNDDGGN